MQTLVVFAWGDGWEDQWHGSLHKPAQPVAREVELMHGQGCMRVRAWRPGGGVADRVEEANHEQGREQKSRRAAAEGSRQRGDLGQAKVWRARLKALQRPATKDEAASQGDGLPRAVADLGRKGGVCQREANEGFISRFESRLGHVSVKRRDQNLWR
ncbi:hypothetical protein GOP47_0005147 [Adiantum capillus-veneris]|uniref:Uncharacterized protein n=1 Tax=Adiantum capillus-veneris TaxID=13818 RepID=A0A9D4V5P0_ADICA|nr:hypothetical protein GOP47_0005147 [Adiantum capillus-veneris]